MVEEQSATILIIEDNAATLQTLTKAFQRAGISVLSALDGEQGLTQALGERPAAIVLDILMAKMDGITMLKKLRQDAWGKEVPVIILTNLTYLEDMPEVKSLASEFLLKADVTMDDIVLQVKKHLAGAAAG